MNIKQKIYCFVVVLVPFFAHATEISIPEPIMRVVDESNKVDTVEQSAKESTEWILNFFDILDNRIPDTNKKEPKKIDKDVEKNRLIFARNITRSSIGAQAVTARLLETKDTTSSLHSGYFSPDLSNVKMAYKENPKNINNIGKDGTTPLMHATKFNRTEIVKFLLQNGANVNIGDTIFEDKNSNPIAENVTPLIMAIMNGNLPIIELLISANADVNINCIEHITETQRSPLMFAISIGRLDIVKYLVTNGSDMNFVANAEDAAVFKQYFTPVTTAIDTEQFEILKYLVSKGATLQGASKYAVINGSSWEITEYLSQITSDNYTKYLKRMTQLIYDYVWIRLILEQALYGNDTDFSPANTIPDSNLYETITIISVLLLIPEQDRDTFLGKKLSNESILSAFFYIVQELNYKNLLFKKTNKDSYEMIMQYLATKLDVDKFTLAFFTGQLLHTNFSILARNDDNELRNETRTRSNNNY